MAAAGRASKRVAKELEKFQQAPVPGLEVAPNAEDSNEWFVQVTGAEGTLYQGEQYTLRVRFNSSYPMEAPEVVFLTPAPMHPHIYANGHICLSIL
jgi:ubiquitin-conjugating enzyme E2 W